MRNTTLIFAIPARAGGALTILEDQYDRAMQDRTRTSVFIVSTPTLKDNPSVRVHQIEWPTRSILHRLVFELFAAPALIRRYRATEVLSLDNLAVLATRVPQRIYLHQALALTDPAGVRISSTSRRLRIALIRALTRWSVHRADEVIVQTAFMKRLCHRVTGVPLSRITIQQPNIAVPPPVVDEHPGKPAFFYPAAVSEYKNHEVLFQAVERLLNGGVTNFEVWLTFDGSESNQAARLRRRAEVGGLPVLFLGQLERSEVMQRYRKSILVFPSILESFGLPLYEARALGAKVIAADYIHSREALEDYSNVRFFPGQDPESLAHAMAASLSENA